ncbi:recombinase family protein, partial [Staphylococcus haemolyticus]
LVYKKISQHLYNNHKLIPRKPYQVINILLNTNYCGRVINKYCTFNDIVPPIIDVDMFEESQDRRIHNQHHLSNYRNKLNR